MLREICRLAVGYPRQKGVKMVASSQQHVEGYLRSAGFNLLNTDQGFLVADKPGVGGDRDTLLVWLPR
jgi:hypothetical protein